MKKLIRKFKLRRFKDSIPENGLNQFSGYKFIVLYQNGKYKPLENKAMLESELKRNSADIWYIFDMVDRIILDMDIEIEQEKEKNE